MGLASPNLDTQLDAVPTNTELNARTLPSADYATAAAQTTTDGKVDDVLTDIAALPTAVENADALLTRDWTAIAGSIPSRCALNALRFLRNAWSIVSGSVTVTEEDDTTPVYSKPVTPAPGADPISGVGADE